MQLMGGSPQSADEIVGLSPLVLAPLVLIFVFSAMLPFFGQQGWWKYRVAIFLAFCATACMIIYISSGLRLDRGGGQVEGSSPTWICVHLSKHVREGCAGGMGLLLYCTPC